MFGCERGDVIPSGSGSGVEGVADYGWHNLPLAWRLSERQLGAGLRWNEVIVVFFEVG